MHVLHIGNKIDIRIAMTYMWKTNSVKNSELISAISPSARQICVSFKSGFFFGLAGSLLGAWINCHHLSSEGERGMLGSAMSFITWHWSPRPPRSPFAPRAFVGSWAGSRRSGPFSGDPHRRRSDPDWDCSCSVTSARASRRSPAILAPYCSAISYADFETRSLPANIIH